jgi:hypothetical protein
VFAGDLCDSIDDAMIDGAMGREIWSDVRLAHPQPRSGARMQPTAQAVGRRAGNGKALSGRKSVLIQTQRQVLGGVALPALRSKPAK